MEMPKVCLGCFAQWDEEAPACPQCGWEPGGEYEETLQWKSGMVLERRYLLGKLFCKEQDTAVWRAYDNLLFPLLYIQHSLLSSAEAGGFGRSSCRSGMAA